jgi:hypothetical protein
MLFRIFAFSLALLFGSPALEKRIDFKAASPPSPTHFEKLWLVTYLNEAGVEAIAQGRASSGEVVPLIATDAERLSSIVEAGRAIASARKVKMRLVEFSSRSEVGEFTP